MKKNITKLFYLLITLCIAQSAFSQSITSVTVPNGPTDCTNTIIDVDATQLCINHVYNGVTTAVTGNTITIELIWTNNSPICLGALAFITENINLGQLAAGNYSVEVKGVFNGSQQSIMTQSMNIISCCPVSSTIQGQTNICLGDSVLLVGSATNATSSYWSQGSTVISNNDSLMLTFQSVGTYTYDFYATDGSCNDIATQTITVSDFPVVDLGADTSICTGEAVLLNATSSGATGYNWNTGNNGATLNVTLPGTYTVVVSNNGCTGTDSITIGGLTSPVFDLGMNSLICQGDSVVLDATVNQMGTTYSWSDGSTAPTLAVLASGTYSVTVTNSINCSYDDVVAINVEALPMPNLGSDTTLCTGTLQLTDLGLNASYNYVWSTGEVGTTITVDSAGTYSVTATSDNGCVGTDDIVVSYEVPSLDLGDTVDLVNVDSIILDAQNIGASYVWNTGETTQTITVDSTGTYSVTVTNAAGCATISSVVVVNTTSTNKIQLKQVKVFPNPASDYLIIENIDNEFATARVINAYGQLVKTVSLQRNQKIEVQELSSGFYYIQFQNDDNQVIGTTRFIKQ